jgi:hypothetical protein
MLSGYWNGGVGCSIETLAELIGDTPKVAFDHYGREWGQHYQEPLWAAIGVAAHSDAPPSAAAARQKPKASGRPRAASAGKKSARRKQPTPQGRRKRS